MLGAVLNGGSSSRMGVDKSTIEYRGVTFLDRAVDTLSGVTEHVVVAGRPVDGTDAEVVLDAVEGSGPLAGVVSALHRAAGEPVMVLAVDLPLVSRELLANLIDAHIRSDQAVVVRQDGRPQPLCGVYGPDLIGIAHDRLRTADLSMRSFLRSVPVLTFVDVDHPSVWNINTPDDLEQLS